MERIIITKARSLVPTLISEYALWEIPKNNFNIYSWTIGESLTDFCSDILCLTIENLIISNILSLSLEIKEQKVLWLINTYKKEYILQLNTQIDSNSLGWLEYHILQQFTKNKKQVYQYLIKDLIISFLQSSSGILSRSIIAAVAENAKSHLISTSIDKGLFSKRITITIDNSFPASKYYKTWKAINEEQKTNEEFNQFSIALRKFTALELSSQQHKD